MENSCLMEEIKSEIERKRYKLNKMILTDINREELLKYSVELDRLIDKYYLELNKNRAGE
ncbi:MAG: Spo0E family sporulation regulatory protein-aspartic acid phosphatase [Tissierellia bacterium]|nr:Spo0E family sporulation regulatory protein-aspartic acid phosphatase [Tissierellia bacterium]